MLQPLTDVLEITLSDGDKFFYILKFDERNAVPIQDNPMVKKDLKDRTIVESKIIPLKTIILRGWCSDRLDFDYRYGD